MSTTDLSTTDCRAEKMAVRAIPQYALNSSATRQPAIPALPRTAAGVSDWPRKLEPHGVLAKHVRLTGTPPTHSQGQGRRAPAPTVKFVHTD